MTAPAPTRVVTEADIAAWKEQMKAQGMKSARRDYFDYHNICPRCLGAGRTAEASPCRRCEGTGTYF